MNDVAISTTLMQSTVSLVCPEVIVRAEGGATCTPQARVITVQGTYAPAVCK